jgi:hypothetical protein
LKRIWGLFLPALPVLRLIVQTTTIETAFGCPQTPAKGFLRCALPPAAPAGVFLDPRNFILDPRKLILDPKKTILSPDKSLFYNDLSALRASLGIIWGNQFPQTPNQRLPALRLCVIEAR